MTTEHEKMRRGERATQWAAFPEVVAVAPGGSQSSGASDVDYDGVLRNQSYSPVRDEG